MGEFPHSTTALLSDAPDATGIKWRKATVHIRDPLPDEILVRIVASGVCHTDIALSSVPPGAPGFSPYPRVTGHEGAGIVESVGSQITHVQPGDKVLLSFDYCDNADACRACADDTPGYCNEFLPKNIFGVPDVYRLDDGGAGGGLFFGQSSFSQLAVVKGTSALNVQGLVKNEEELKVFAPMGCGYQTGAAAVTELADVKGGDDVCVSLHREGPE